MTQRTFVPALALALAVALWLLCTQEHSWSARRWGWAGTGDFLGYWSSARLLRQGQNPYDARALFQIEQAPDHVGNLYTGIIDIVLNFNLITQKF